MSKILLFSDAHIHSHKNSQRRLQHCLEALEWVFKIAIDNNIDDVVFLGDLFQDREKIQVLPYQLTYEIINKYCGKNGLNINLYLLVGNHDMWFADKSDISSVYPFGSIENVRVISKCETLNIAGLNIDFLPFTLNPPKSLQIFKNRSPVLCGHIALDGAQLNTFFKTQADVSVEYDGDMVKVDSTLLKDWQRVFLGHYHGEQRIGHVEYIGSPLQLNFAEAFQKKHIIILDTEDLSTEYVENTFSPRHLILTEDQVPQYDLNNVFLRLQPKDINSTDLVELKKSIVENNNILTFELSSSISDEDMEETKEVLQESTLLLNHNNDMLEEYMKAFGTNGLYNTRLLEIGRMLCSKSQME